MRIGDKEREDALVKLGEHMSAGRLDIDEYGERTAKVTAAKTRGELLDIFGDLPEPRPVFGRPAPPPAPVPPRGRLVVGRIVPALLPILLVLATVGLLYLVKSPFVVLLPFLFIAVSGRRWRGQHHHR